MRGGTSKGPFFLTDDLPQDVEIRDKVLISALGAGHALQIDGVGGGNPVTSKVAIVGRSRRPDADVEYLFAQVSVEERRVDTTPNCGNMLA
ncbi:PrpF domain-containing protein, partial [Stenotrophomonas sp. GbtcB23]|uniref:PrpF domain-containing protein n=1 Tax=Stenotrophomonas sp. GbtcB23 TaxID=2824768 RepID=UPI002672C6FF